VKKKVLFIIGSPNQTSQMYQIYLHLKDEFDCYFTQFFAGDWMMELARRLKTMEHTIISGHFRQKGEQFVKDHGLQYDYAGKQLGNKYDLVFMCNDATFPKVARKAKSIWVQEGMVDPLTPWAKWVKRLGLPPYMAMRTALNGCMNYADLYCAASDGYKDYFTSMGTNADRIVVTGMPNFDNAAQYLNNDFPLKDYVLVCTSDIRETFRKENRIEFIRQCVAIAAGKPLVFKLHPNEIWDRAYYEIINNTPPGTQVFQHENTNHMIANCQELITQYSTVVYIGMALGKPVHSYFPYETLKKLMPIQNGGKSAQNIAEIAKKYIHFEGKGEDFVRANRSWLETLAHVTPLPVV